MWSVSSNVIVRDFVSPGFDFHFEDHHIIHSGHLLVGHLLVVAYFVTRFEVFVDLSLVCHLELMSHGSRVRYDELDRFASRDIDRVGAECEVACINFNSAGTVGAYGSQPL